MLVEFFDPGDSTFLNLKISVKSDNLSDKSMILSTKEVPRLASSGDLRGKTDQILHSCVWACLFVSNIHVLFPSSGFSSSSTYRTKLLHKQRQTHPHPSSYQAILATMVSLFMLTMTMKLL